MTFFDNLKISLRQKWLQFFQANRSWINLYTDAASVATPDGGKRPASYLILGVINALEPQLAQLMLPFSKLNSDVDTLIEVLELNFDPNLALEDGSTPTPQTTKSVEAQDLPLSDAEIARMLPPQVEEITVVQTLTQLSDMPLEETTTIEFVAPPPEQEDTPSRENNSAPHENQTPGDVISRLFPNF